MSVESTDEMFANKEFHGMAIPKRQAKVTPSDDTVFPGPGQLYVGVGGNVRARMIGGGVETYYGVNAGQYIHGLFDMVLLNSDDPLDTGTTASRILIVWT